MSDSFVLPDLPPAETSDTDAFRWQAAATLLAGTLAESGKSSEAAIAIMTRIFLEAALSDLSWARYWRRRLRAIAEDPKGEDVRYLVRVLHNTLTREEENNGS